PSVGGLGHHLDVVFRLEQRPDAAADQRLVVGEQDPDQVAGVSAGISARTWKPPPSLGPACSRPPSAVTRSRMPMRPRRLLALWPLLALLLMPLPFPLALALVGSLAMF